MHIPPEIRALVAQPALLERAQERHAAALAAWQREPGAAAVLDAFAAFAAGAELGQCPALAALFGAGTGGGADAFFGSLAAALLPVLAAEPFGHVPLRHQATPASATLLLAQDADWVDLDGPLLLARDRPDGLTYEGALVSPPQPTLWG